MIETSLHEHNLPGKTYVKIYYTDGYTILEKRFSDMDYAKPFIKILKSNVDFHFIKARAALESDVRI